MDEQIFEEDVDRNIGVESDLDKILQYLAGEDPCCQRSISTLIHSDHPAFYSPKIDSFDHSPWLSSPLAKDEPYCFASQILPEDPEVHLATISSSLLALETELLDPFTPDLATSSITDDIQTVICSDNLKQRMSQLQLPDLSRLVSPLSHVDSSGHAYSPPPENSGRFYPFSEFLFGGEEGATVMNTPNSSSSYSSFREEAVVEEISDAVANSPDDHRVVFGSKRKVAEITVAADESLASMPDCKKQNKTSRKGKKRVREARYAIQTRSDKEVLEDGYKWRKYGQKAVKNSPHPRSYYRCTFNKCSVKKTVERSCKDSGLVITTYEGVHAHPSPSAIRSTTSDHSLFLNSMINTPPFSRQIIHPLQFCTSSTTNPRIMTFESSTQFRGGAQYHHLPPLDRGLLEDMLPSTIRTSTY